MYLPPFVLRGEATLEELRLQTNGSIWVHEYRTSAAERMPDRIRRRTREEIEGERLAAENERSARLRHVYKAIGLAVTAHKDGTLLQWSFGKRALPVVTVSGSPVLRRIYAPDEG